MANTAQIIIGVVKLFPQFTMAVVSMSDWVPLAAPILNLVALRDFFAEHTKHAWL